MEGPEREGEGGGAVESFVNTEAEREIIERRTIREEFGREEETEEKRLMIEWKMRRWAASVVNTLGVGPLGT